MEDDGSITEEEDIFAGIEAPASETGSEYQNSDDENGDGRGHGKSLKSREKLVAELSSDEAQDDGSDQDAARTTFSQSDVLKNERLSKRKESPVKVQVPDSKKVKTPGTWILHSKYRDLLNIDIADITARNISSDNISLEDSQIGSVFWTSSEKDKLFVALSRLGQDNVKGISEQVVTKSESEVQAYLQLLRRTLIEKRSRAVTFELPDFPAAVEISQECCEQLENTANAFAALQEEHETKIEEAKWGKSWLLTPETSHWLNKKRGQKNGEKAIADVLPAANLFNLDVWLELSERIFMNAGPSENEDNWHNLAVEGEVPALRATAFEDLHSLTVFITRKLVSTTLFCTMSRQRAIRSGKRKAAEVNAEDVSAAVDILKMSHDSEAYWMTCARRCRLQIVDDDNIDDSGERKLDDLEPLSYDDVEAALSDARLHPKSRSRSRSRSTSYAQQRLSTPFISNENSPVSESDIPPSPKSPPPSPIPLSSPAHPRARLVRAQALQSQIAALEKYTESLDQQASLAEELRLWSILKKDVPDDILGKIETVQNEDVLERPSKREDERDERYEWRDWVNFKGAWEDCGVPGEAEFIKNRMRRRQRSTEVNSRDGESELGDEFVFNKDDGVDGEDDQDDQEVDYEEFSDEEFDE